MIYARTVDTSFTPAYSTCPHGRASHQLKIVGSLVGSFQEISTCQPQTERNSYTTPHLDSKSPIEALPDELLIHILTFLSSDLHTLACCTRVSHLFDTCASPLLWRHLTLHPQMEHADPKDESAPINSTSVIRRFFDPTLSKRLEHVKTLSIHHHTSYWCRPDTSPSLHLPNLETLDIHLDKDNHNHFHDRTRTPAHTSTSSCPLLLDLKPSNLIIRMEGFERVIYGYGGLPSEIFEKVDNVTIIPRIHIDDIAFFDPYEALPRPPRGVKSVTIIFNIFPIRQIISQSTLSQRRRREKYANIQKMVEDFADARITFVNLEQCDEYYSNYQIALDMRQAIEEHLDGIDERWWSREKKVERKRTVHFRRMGEWVDEMRGQQGNGGGEEEGFWRWSGADSIL